MRKLAAGALSFSAAIFAANYILPKAWLLPGAAFLAALALMLLIFRRKWLLGFEIGLFAAAFALCVFYVHSERTAGTAAELDKGEYAVEAVLLDYPRVYEDYCSVYIRLQGDGMPHLKALLYDNEKQLENAVPGQNIKLNARVRNADTRYGEDYDHYYAKGIYLILNSKSDIRITGESGGVYFLPVRLRHSVADMTDRLFAADTAHFMRSLLLGDKSGLYDDAELYVSLSRAGFMHIAAVSGMHIAFFAAFIQLFAGRGRVGSLLSILLMWLFVLVTGSTPSAVRAAFMQSALLIAPLAGRENDPITSLSTVLSIVLLSNPYAAASVSLQLSFGAMAGIMCFTEPIISAISAALGNGSLAERLRKPVSVAAMSLSVMVFTTPLMAIHFGYISILSPLSNLLALWTVPYIFCGGLICCAVGAIAPALGTFLAALVSWAARYVFFVVGIISDIDFAVVYLDNIFMWGWLLLSLTALLGALFIKLPGVFRLTYPILMSALILTEAGLLARNHYASGKGTAAVLDVGQGQSVAFISEGGTMLFDCGGGGTLNDAGFTAASYFISRGISELDALVLSHIHSDHANGVLTLMEMLEIENIYMPAEPPDEDGLLQPIIESADRHGAAIHYLKDDCLLRIGGIEAILFRPSHKGDANESCLMSRVSLSDYDVFISADAPEEAELELLERSSVEESELFVVGHHGSRYSSSVQLLKALGAETAVISVGYNNYGHPTHEVLRRLSACGMDIYRTDINGTVEIRP